MWRKFIGSRMTYGPRAIEFVRTESKQKTKTKKHYNCIAWTKIIFRPLNN